MISKYLELYQKRYKFDRLVQTSFADDYTELDEDLQRFFSPDVSGPYERGPTDDFTKNNTYVRGAPTWYNGKLSEGEDYLYRIDNLYKLLNYNKDNVLNLSGIRRKYSFNDFSSGFVDVKNIPILFNKIELLSNPWISLSNFLLQYKPPRNLSWWTNEITVMEDEKALLENAHKLGMATNWISSYSIVIRCNYKMFAETEHIQNFKVPSVIDAYRSPIFLAQRESNKPTCGIAINLKDISSRGSKEYVIRNVPLELLEIRLFKISDKTIKDFEFGAETESLYDKIIGLY